MARTQSITSTIVLQNHIDGENTIRSTMEESLAKKLENELE